MRSFIIVASLVIASATSWAGTALKGVPAGTQKFVLNDAVGKNSIQFLSDAPMEKINGTADGVTGSFSLDPGNLEATNGKIQVKVLAMKTAMVKRDEHMYSEMWLDEAKFPTIEFDVQSLSNILVSNNGKQPTANANASGKFTVHGVTKPMTARITITYVPESAETKGRASGNLIALKATFTVKLSDFGITGKSGLIGSKVGETIEITADLFGNS